MTLFLLVMSYIVTVVISIEQTHDLGNCTACYDENCSINNCYVQCPALSCPEGFAHELVNNKTCHQFPVTANLDEAFTVASTITNVVGNDSKSTTGPSTTSEISTVVHILPVLYVSSCYKCHVTNCSECPIEDFISGCTRCNNGFELVIGNNSSATCVRKTPGNDNVNTSLVLAYALGAAGVVVLTFCLLCLYRMRWRRRWPKMANIPMASSPDPAALWPEDRFGEDTSRNYENMNTDLFVPMTPLNLYHSTEFVPYDDQGRASAKVSRTSSGDTLCSLEAHIFQRIPQQCLPDAAKTISVQTNCSVLPSTSKTVFGTSWQFSGTFTCQGGDIQASGSDVVLIVPPGAVPKTTVMEIYGAIFIDSPDVRMKFRIPSDESLVTPIVEYIGLPISNFERSVDIRLPHALPPDFDTESVKVYTFTVDDRGEVTLSCLPFRSKSNTNIVGEASWEEDQARSKICISTSHFSGYFCTLCGGSSRLPSVFSMIFGSHVQSEHRERREIKLIVYLWDRRLNIKDYQTRFCREERELDRQFLKDMQVPLLNDVSSDSHILMRMEFLDDERDGQCWRHVSRAGGTRYLFKPLQARRLSEIMECCRRTEPIRVEWAVENKPGVEPGPVFQCCIDVMHAPESTRDYEAALNEDLDDLRRSFYVRDLRVLCRHDTEKEMSVPNLNATHESNFDPTQLKLNLSKSLTLQQAERLCLELGFAPRDIGNFHKKFSSESDVKTALLEACISRVGPDKLASKMPTLLEKLQLEPGLESAKKQTLPGRTTVTKGAEPTARSIQVADCRKKLNQNKVAGDVEYDTSETVPKQEQSLDENKNDTSLQHATSVKTAYVLELDSTSQRQHDVLSNSQTFDNIHRPNSSGYRTSELLGGFSSFSTLSNGCDEKSSENGNTIACDSTCEHIQNGFKRQK